MENDLDKLSQKQNKKQKQKDIIYSIVIMNQFFQNYSVIKLSYFLEYDRILYYFTRSVLNICQYYNNLNSTVISFQFNFQYLYNKSHLQLSKFASNKVCTMHDQQQPAQKYYTKFKCLNPQAINCKVALKKATNSNNNARIISKNHLNFDFLSQDQSLLISKQFSKVSKDKKQVSFNPKEQKISVFQILSRQSLNIPTHQKQMSRNQNIQKILLDTLIQIKLQTKSQLQCNKQLYNQLLYKSQNEEKKKQKIKSKSVSRLSFSATKSFNLRKSNIKLKKSQRGCKSLSKLYKTSKFW